MLRAPFWLDDAAASQIDWMDRIQTSSSLRKEGKKIIELSSYRCDITRVRVVIVQRLLTLQLLGVRIKPVFCPGANLEPRSSYRSPSCSYTTAIE